MNYWLYFISNNPSWTDVNVLAKKKCVEKNCKACKIYANYYFKLDKYSNVKFKLMNNATCIFRNIIYIIICNGCFFYYVGESSKSLKERTSQHINHITNFIPYKKYENKEVARHFKICVFKTDIENDEIGWNIEQLEDLINIFFFFLFIYLKRKANEATHLSWAP